MNTNTGAALVVLKHLFKELETKNVLSYLERARMLDAAKFEIGDKLSVERFHKAFDVIGDLWD